MGKKTVAASEFTDAYEGVCSRVSTTLRDYLRDPNDEHTHDLRVAIRKFRVLTGLVPKKANSKELRRYRRRCRRLLDLTSKVRDLDIVKSRLEGQGTDLAVQHAMARLEDEREVCVGDSMNVGLKLFDSALPGMSEKKLPKMGKSLGKTLDGLDKGLARLLPAVVKDEGLVAELHAVRKDLRRLRYLTELLPRGRKNSNATESLRRWQDMIGAIRDSDIVVWWLRDAEQSPKMRDLASAEKKTRHSLYRGFVDAYSAHLSRHVRDIEQRSAIDVLVSQPTHRTRPD